MNRLVTALLLMFISMPVFAESWICESEYSAQVWHRNGEVQGAAGDKDEEPLRLRVDDEGVRDADGDHRYFSACISNGKTVTCSDEGDARRSLITDPQHVFTLIGVSIDKEDTVFDFVFKGICKKDDA